MICPGCGTSCSDDAHLCEKCGAPLTAHAATDPVLSIFTEGYAARKAVSKPRNLIVVIGMWAWLGPIFFGSLSSLIYGWFVVLRGLINGEFDQMLPACVAIPASVFFLFLSGPMLYRTTKAYRAGRQARTAPARPGEQTRLSSDIDQGTLSADVGELITCMECGHMIPSSATMCTECGWSYTEVTPAP